MDDSAVLKEEGVSVAPPQAEGAVPAVDESPCIFQALKGGSQLLPEIRIDTSRLDGLLTSFQRRLQILETSFARIAESAAEAAHKVSKLAASATVSAALVLDRWKHLHVLREQIGRSHSL